MNLLALRYFHLAARLRTISAAARQLRISQPALSKMIRGLETELGHRLLDRTRTGVTLTAEGETVYRSAETIFREAHALTQRLQDPRAPLTGVLRLGISDNLAIHLFPSLLCQFRRENPGLRLEIFTGTAMEIRREILADRCDLGFFFTPLRSGEADLFTSGTLFSLEFWVVVNPTLARQVGRPLTAARILKRSVPIVGSRRKDYEAVNAAAHFHAVHLGFSEPPAIEVNHHEVKKALILEGAGFGILTEPTVRREVREKRLLRVSTPEPLRSDVFWAGARDFSHRAASEFLRQAQAFVESPGSKKRRSK